MILYRFADTDEILYILSTGVIQIVYAFHLIMPHFIMPNHTINRVTSSFCLLESLILDLTQSRE